MAGDGRVVASASRPYPTERTAAGAVTQDARDWLRAVAEAGREALAGASADGARIEAIGVTGVAHNAVLVGRDDEPLSRVIIYDDARPEATAAALRTRHGSGFFERTYAELTATWTLPQLVWLRGQAPGLWPSIRHVLPMKDYVRASLTGGGPSAALTDPSDAVGMALVDQRRGDWDPDLVAETGLDVDRLPTISPATDLAGGLDRGWARRLGLRPGTPVAVGATDTAAELVSLGAVDPGVSLIKIASTGTVVVVSDRPRPDRRLLTYPHVEAGRWYSLAATNTAATSLTWIRAVAHPSDRSDDPPGRAMRLARRVPAGADGLLYLPFLEGERTPFWDRELRAAFIGLTSAHGTGHLYRAVLEGVALSLRSCRDLVVDIGFRVEEPFLGGGPMADPLWRSILVAALGQPARLASRQGPSLGAALIAAAATAAPPAADGRPGRRPPSRRILPRPDWADVYSGRYELYRSAADAVAATSRALARSRPTKPRPRT
jgi:xylulokinase